MPWLRKLDMHGIPCETPLAKLHIPHPCMMTCHSSKTQGSNLLPRLAMFPYVGIILATLGSNLTQPPRVKYEVSHSYLRYIQVFLSNHGHSRPIGVLIMRATMSSTSPKITSEKSVGSEPY